MCIVYVYVLYMYMYMCMCMNISIYLRYVHVCIDVCMHQKCCSSWSALVQNAMFGFQQKFWNKLWGKETSTRQLGASMFSESGEWRLIASWSTEMSLQWKSNPAWLRTGFPVLGLSKSLSKWRSNHQPRGVEHSPCLQHWTDGAVDLQ